MKSLGRGNRAMRITVVAAAPLLALTMFGGIANAQTPQGSEVNQPTNDSFPSQPTRTNQGRTTTRVAAPIEQIRAVLVKDPGLLLELEHIVERETIAKGQLVEDADLTQQAILDRLDEDVAFRATATLLLQRYGYLRPNVNPDSELGKEQELVLRERARRIVQIEAQEDAQSLQPQKRDDDSIELEGAGTCESRTDRNCHKSSPRRFSEDSVPGPSREFPGTPPDIPPSSTPSPQVGGSPLWQVRLSPGTPSEGEGGSGTSDLLRLAAMNGSSDDWSSATSPGMLQRFLDNARGNRASVDDVAMRRTGSVPDSSDRNASLAANSSRNRGTSPHEANGDLSQGTIVHTLNPYSDVPSLVDLYVQVAAQNRAPERFGIDILRDNGGNSDALPMDLPVGPDYVVGPGDGLAIDLWGGMSQRLQRTVDSQGRISLPDYGPVLVSGKTLGDVQLTVQQLLRTQLRDVSTDVSLSRLRTVRVYVVGEVTSPGAYDVSSLSSPLNALEAAGGVTGRGSLRSIKHFRGRQLIEVVDAYDLLLRGVGPDQKRLENGDSLLVPPVGPQVTIEGMVRRPAIYELSGNIPLEDALALAGGVLPAAAMKHIEVERLVAHETHTMLSLDLSDSASSAESTLRGFQIQDGDRIHVFPIAPYNDRAIYLQGHVLRPGRYSYTAGMTVRDLITSYSDLLPEPSEKYAEIIRLNPPDLHPTVESFDLNAALSNAESAPKLKPLDTVRIFSRYDFESAPKVWVDGEVRSPGEYATSGQARLRDALYLAGGVSPDADLDSAQIIRSTKNDGMKIISANLTAALAGDSGDNPLLQSNDRIIVHRNVRTVEPAAVYVEGDVPSPGRYPLAANMRVDDLLLLAGGLKPSADTHTAVLTHHDDGPSDPGAIQITKVNLPEVLAGQQPANRLLANGDVLTIRENPGWHDLGATVTLRGEVEHPGTYGIRPGESLGSVLEKAGGFAPQAYVYGTVLTRREVRDLEMKSHDELVARLQTEQQELKALPENDADQKSQKLNAIAQTDTALTQLETHLPAGRVVLQGTLDQKSFEQEAAKTPLRNGDVILVPKKPDYVVVQGQVFNGTAIGYIPGRSANWYLGQAGGFTELADKKAAFVIRADGSVLAAKNNRGIWSGNPMDAVLMPGDVIVVPEKAPKVGTRNITPLMQSAQVATSVALAIAYLKP